jgi:hypothetical protein
MGQENGHVNLVDWPPSSASPATEGQQLVLLNASFSGSPTWKSRSAVKVKAEVLLEFLWSPPFKNALGPFKGAREVLQAVGTQEPVQP